MIVQLLITLLALGLLLAGWLGVQALARRQLPETESERDVLACALCRGGGLCHCRNQDAPPSPDRRNL